MEEDTDYTQSSINGKSEIYHKYFQDDNEIFWK